MLYPIAPQLDFLTTSNMLLAAALIGGILAMRLLYSRVMRPQHMSGTMSRR